MMIKNHYSTQAVMYQLFNRMLWELKLSKRHLFYVDVELHIDRTNYGNKAQ